MHSDARRILIVNGKGGCGKTTIATNLAVAYANKGHRVSLIDNDPQAASTFWSTLRSKDLPPVEVIPAHAKASMYQTQTFHDRISPHATRVIVDGQSNARDRDLEALMRQVDVVLIPLLPSALDMHVGEAFITDLLTHRAYRSAPRPIAVIANRVQPNTDTHQKLEQFLSCLNLPCVATFRDSPIYTQAAERGEGVVDMRDVRAARKETASWWQLAEWIDAQKKHARVTVRELRQRPKQPLAANQKPLAANQKPLAANQKPLAANQKPLAAGQKNVSASDNDADSGKTAKNAANTNVGANKGTATPRS